MTEIATPTPSLDEVIKQREVELAELKKLQTTEYELSGSLDKIREQVRVVLNGNKFANQATDAIRTITDRVETRKLHQILSEIIETPGTFIRPSVLADEALKTGYRTKAKDFYANVLQLVKSDKRFKVRKVAGSKKDIEVTIRKPLAAV